MAGLPDDLVEFVGVRDPQTAAPVDNSIHDGTGQHRLIEHPQHLPADVEGPKPSQKIETALALFVDRIHIFGPVQFIVQVHPVMVNSMSLLKLLESPQHAFSSAHHYQ